jgi:hypothetical protein
MAGTVSAKGPKFFASGGVRLNSRELLFGEARKFTTQFCAHGHAMSVTS